jgi:hypothetical protein
MKTLMAYTSRILNKRFFVGAGILLLCVLLSLSGCRGFYKHPVELINAFETELKEEFPYVKEFHMYSGTPVFVDWQCYLSKEKPIDELDGLIERLKEFAASDETSQALVDTGDFSSKYGLYDIGIAIYYPKAKIAMYSAVTDFDDRNGEWSVKIGGRGSYEQPVELIDAFEAELKEEFPYVEKIELRSGTPAETIWICHLSEEKKADELTDLIERLKEFAGSDETCQALEDTGDFASKNEMNDILVAIRNPKTDTAIYRAVANFNDRGGVWSVERDT